MKAFSNSGFKGIDMLRVYFFPLCLLVEGAGLDLFKADLEESLLIPKERL